MKLEDYFEYLFTPCINISVQCKPLYVKKKGLYFITRNLVGQCNLIICHYFDPPSRTLGTGLSAPKGSFHPAVQVTFNLMLD